MQTGVELYAGLLHAWLSLPPVLLCGQCRAVLKEEALLELSLCSVIPGHPDTFVLTPKETGGLETGCPPRTCLLCEFHFSTWCLDCKLQMIPQRLQQWQCGSRKPVAPPTASRVLAGHCPRQSFFGAGLQKKPFPLALRLWWREEEDVPTGVRIKENHLAERATAPFPLGS